MDLHSGLPLWIAKNKLYAYHQPLNEDITTTFAIIGSGITGSLVAAKILCKAIQGKKDSRLKLYGFGRLSPL